MAFERVASWLPSPPSVSSDAPSPDLPAVGVAPFSDDLEPTPGVRLGVRVCLLDRDGGGYDVDFSDTEGPHPEFSQFVLTPDQTRTAAAIAVGHALGLSPGAVTGALDILCPASTWVGRAEPSPDPAVTAFAMARVFDAVSGALAHAWPSRVGAGSCTLGAVVELSADDDTFTEVLPGGQGATPTGPGRSAWSGPILETRTPVGLPSWLTVQQTPRLDSGGIGARNGGHGIVRRYRVERTVQARVAIDRVANPPHGIDRAGPPRGSVVRLESPARVLPAPPRWLPFEVLAGEALVVETCGGAGHGFPGYGDIEYEPD